MTQPEGFTPVSTHGPGGRGALGLSQQEAEARLARFGANDAVPTRQRTLLAQLLGRFANPLVIILLLAGLLSGVLGDPVNALIITGIVLLSVALEFTQTQRSLRAAEALRDQVAMTATVLRDGGWREVARREVVPGDLIRLSAGDLIPPTRC
jgi:Mg2+-importing ATPase